MPPARLRLGELLVEAGIINERQLEGVLVLQKADGRRLGTLLVEAGLVNETQLTQILSQQLNAPWVSLYHIDFSRQLLSHVPRDVVEKYCLVPIYVRQVRGQGDTLYVAMDDPSNEEGLRAVKEAAGLPVRAMIAPPSDIRNAIRVYYGGRGSQPSIHDLAAAAVATGSEPIIVAAFPVATPVAAAAPVIAAEEPPPARAPEPSVGIDVIEDVAEATPSPPPSQVAPTTTRSTPPSSPMPTPAPFVAPAPAPTPAPESLAPASESFARLEPPASSARAPRSAVQQAARRGPRMISLTLLDGTTITVPAKKKRDENEPPPSQPEEEDALLTARDLIAALRAVSHGADASEILGTARWETLFAALLSLLLRKHLIADWEFIEEFKKI